MTISRRKLLTFLTGGITGIGVTIAALPFFRYLTKADHIKPPLWAQKIEFPKLQPGQMMTVSSPRNTLYILRRTHDQIAALDQPNIDLLDSGSEDSLQPEFARNNFRSLRPEIFVAWGACTHLGCGTTHVHPENTQHFYQESFRKGGGFFCPCHGAIYDSAGRVYKGMPAERNLDIPEYEFIDETTIRITDTKAF